MQNYVHIPRAKYVNYSVYDLHHMHIIKTNYYSFGATFVLKPMLSDILISLRIPTCYMDTFAYCRSTTSQRSAQSYFICHLCISRFPPVFLCSSPVCFPSTPTLHLHISSLGFFHSFPPSCVSPLLSLQAFAKLCIYMDYCISCYFTYLRLHELFNESL